jgi:hypothetical protein
MASRALTNTQPVGDPATIGFPPTLPIEVAMRVAPIRDICEAYDLNREDWEALRHDPLFIIAVAEAKKALSKEGMSFKMKARLQSEELLKTSWTMIHASSDEVPPNVKADLIKFTIRAAGLDGSKDQVANAVASNALQININLG